MFDSERFIEKGNVPDNTNAISDDTGFVSVTEMPIDILVLDVRVGFSLLTAKADLFLAGITQLLALIFAYAINQLKFFKSVRKLLSA